MTLTECYLSCEHLQDCDDDGFCNHCGHQLAYPPYALSTSDGHDEEWEYFDNELEAKDRFVKLQWSEDDIHLYEYNVEFGYEVIDSYWDGEL